MTERTISARVHVHATFTTPEPAPIYIAAVEVLDGAPTVGHFVNIPLNPTLSVTVRILAIAPVANDFGVDLVGLVLNCDDETGRGFIDAFNIGDETWDITPHGDD
ncbi:MAG: hypothetical protein AAF483_25855 [Planctomycetota bacterium]